MSNYRRYIINALYIALFLLEGDASACFVSIKATTMHICALVYRPKLMFTPYVSAYRWSHCKVQGAVTPICINYLEVVKIVVPDIFMRSRQTERERHTTSLPKVYLFCFTFFVVQSGLSYGCGCPKWNNEQSKKRKIKLSNAINRWMRNKPYTYNNDAEKEVYVRCSASVYDDNLF